MRGTRRVEQRPKRVLSSNPLFLFAAHALLAPRRGAAGAMFTRRRVLGNEAL